MWWTKKLSKVYQLSWAEWGLLLEAAVWLAISRLALLLVPFQRIAPRLGMLQHESDDTVSPITAQTAERTGWAVRAVARRTPWESACLAQAMSGKAMLRRRHIQSTLYLGLAKDASQSLQAHAWLRCGTEILTGKAGHERYSVISSFAEQLPQNIQKAKDEIDIAKIQTLLLDTLNPVPKATTAAQLREAEWEALIQAAMQQRVLTLLYARLQGLKMETAVPPHLLTKMQQHYQQVTLQNLAIYRELRLINEKMQAANIPMIVLKGPYLATAVYPHIGQRAVGDLDILVPEDKVLQAVDLMHKLGWQETKQFTLQAIRQHHHHLPRLTKAGVNFPVEIHWNIVHPLCTNTISPAELWREPVTTTVANTGVAVFPPYLQLLHLALHAAYNHQFAFDLRSLCDIALLIDQQQAKIEWDHFVTQALAWQWQRGVYLTLKLVQEFWGTAVPPHVLSQLKPTHMPENLTELAKQQLLWGRGNNKEVSPNFSQLKSSKTMMEKIRFIFYFIIPPRSRLSWQYGVPPQSAKIWLYYPYNLYKLISRNARRTWYLLRGHNRVTEAAERRTELAEWLETT